MKKKESVSIPNSILCDVEAAKYVVMCKGKKAYTTPYHAQYDIDIIESRENVKLRYYKCPFCQNFHLTSQI